MISRFIMISVCFLDLVLTRVSHSESWLKYCKKGTNKVNKSRLKIDEMFQMDRIGPMVDGGRGGYLEGLGDFGVLLHKINKSSLKLDEMLRMERISRWLMYEEAKVRQASAILGHFLLQEVHERDPLKR
jgi:hypothetical protein